MGDGIGLVAVTGVALGLLTGTSPTWTAVVVAVLGAVAIEVIRERGITNGDVALALLFYGGLAGGVLLTGLAGTGAATLQTYLFGSITTIDITDVIVTMALAAIVVVTCVGLSPQLFAVAQDQDFARVAGLRVRAYNLLVAVLAAVSVTVAMRTVGLLLVSALMVVPGRDRPAAHPLVPHDADRGDGARRGRVVGGLLIAAFAPSDANVAPGPTIVLLALAGFAVPGRSAPGCAGASASPRRSRPSSRAAARPRRHGGPPARPRPGLRPRRGPPRRPRRLRPRRPPARRARSAL